jgi:hypothetical protein
MGTYMQTRHINFPFTSFLHGLCKTTYNVSVFTKLKKENKDDMKSEKIIEEQVVGELCSIFD